MNKKLFLSLLAVIGLLFATSCSHEELDVVQESELAQVTFSLGVENAAGTKAISDGLSAKKLIYAVYDVNGNLLGDIANADHNGQIVIDNAFNSERKANVQVTLAKGQTYTIAFWAQNKSISAYNTDNLEAIKVNYEKASNNLESRDAFFATETFTVKGNAKIDVTLTRPFAQINLGVYTSDWNAAVNSGVEIEESSVVVKNAANTLNLLTGSVSGETEVKYNLNTIPNEVLKVDLNKDGDYDDENEQYKWLSMSYILANSTPGDAKATAALEFTLSPKSGNDIVVKSGLNDVPVQRNWRTNILGKLLTGDIDFNIVIDHKYIDDYNITPGEKAVVGTTALETQMDNDKTSTDPVTYNVQGLNESSDVNVTIPADFKSSEVTFNFTDIKNGANLTITGNDYENTVVIKVPSDVTLNTLTITTPKAHVRLEQGSFTNLVASTSPTTLVIGNNVKVSNLTVDQGNVEIEKEGEVENLAAGTNNENPIIVKLEKGAEMPDVKEGTVAIEAKEESTGVYTIELDENLAITEPLVLDKNTVIIGNGKSIISTTNNAIVVSMSNVNISIDNVIIESKESCIKLGDGTQGIILTVKNTQFNGSTPIEDKGNNTIVTESNTYNTTSHPIFTKEDLVSFQESVNEGNTFKGMTVSLLSNIDLNNEEWAPIGTSANKFQGTFDGNNKTISNLNITGNNSYVGLFGFTTDGEIKNLTVNNAKVSGYLGVGVVAGSPYTSKYSNIKVTGHVEVNGFAYVGGVGGRNAYANWTDITVDVDETSYVNANSVENGTAYRTYVGGVIGFMGEGSHTVKNVKSNINVKGSTIDVGGIVGIAHYNNNFENVTCTADVEIYAAEDAEEAQEIGGIAGVWHNENGTKVTFTNCEFTGSLKTNVEGVNFNAFGTNIVCASYNTTGNGVLVIDSKNIQLVNNDSFSAALTSGNTIILTDDVTYGSNISNDAFIYLNGKTFEATYTIELRNNADLSINGGKYVVNGTYGHVDVRPSDKAGSVLTYENVDFSFNKLGPTYGPSTNRLGTVVEVCPTVTDAHAKIVFKNCRFDNAQVLFEGMSGKTGTFEAVFENCTFNALTSSAPIYVQNYLKGEIKIKGCTFNLECTSSTASAISVSPSSSTSVKITAENNTINAVAATPYTYDASKGETEVNNIKVNGTPANIKFVSCYENTTLNETGTTKSGIAN